MQTQPHSYHIHAEDEFFSRKDGIIYRNGKVYRNTINTSTNQHLAMDLIRTNHARVMYYLPPCTPIVEE